LIIYVARSQPEKGDYQSFRKGVAVSDKAASRQFNNAGTRAKGPSKVRLRKFLAVGAIEGVFGLNGVAFNACNTVVSEKGLIVKSDLFERAVLFLCFRS
jgi:hypothetical protein